MNTIIDEDLIIIVCSKNPNEIFIKCIDSLRLFYTSKILVVDSNSDKNLEVYDNIINKYNNIEISMIKNKNWEYGAYKYGFNKYPNFKMYFCLQESCILKQRIEIENEDNIYLYTNTTGWKHFSKHMNRIPNLIKNTKLYDYYKKTINSNFNLCTHNLFIVNNKIIEKIFKKLPNPIMDKIDEMCYERLLGLFFEKYALDNHYKIKDIKKYIEKIHQKKI